MQVLQGGSELRELRVLVADDDPVMRALVRANLKGRIDHITEAADGQAAWDIVQGSSFDLALIDLSMPGIDGFTLIRAIRNHPRTRHLPVVVITSSTDRAAVTSALEAGATAFLTKPINWSLFSHQIDYLIRTDEIRMIDRATRQRAEAVSRAKDALFFALAARVQRQANALALLAEREIRSPQAHCFANEVLLEARGIDQLVRDMLPHVRSMTEQIVTDDRFVPVTRIVEQTIEMNRHLEAEAGVRVEVEEHASDLRVRCNERAIGRALSNLLQNAIEFAPAGSVVWIRVEHRPDNALAIVVEDEGPGVDPNVITRCLMPLDNFDEAADERQERPALGIPMAKAIAQAHGGTVEVVSRQDGGTRACLVLAAEIVDNAEIEDAA